MTLQGSRYTGPLIPPEFKRDLVRVDRLALDSGAHSIFTEYVIKKHHLTAYDFYKSKEFLDYVDNYAAFVKEHEKSLDFYVNVDAIFNPELSWEILKYLEIQHGLKPMPVIHFGTSLRWFEKHLDAGYEYLGIGGLGQEATRDVYMRWADRVFDFLCPRPSRLPIVRTHGFAMTSYTLMIRFPFYSVDSASWIKASAFGKVYVPHKRGGKFVFDEEPYLIGMSSKASSRKKLGQHIENIGAEAKRIVREWLDEVGMPFGSIDDRGESVKWGVLSHHEARSIANLRFFERVVDWLPKYPWAFKIPVYPGLFKEE